jgi:hypothetical protein
MPWGRRRLERAGFNAAPRWLGADEQARDVLSWIDGETFTESGGCAPPKVDYVGLAIGAVDVLDQS